MATHMETNNAAVALIERGCFKEATKALREILKDLREAPNGTLLSKGSTEIPPTALVRGKVQVMSSFELMQLCQCNGEINVESLIALRLDSLALPPICEADWTCASVFYNLGVTFEAWLLESEHEKFPGNTRAGKERACVSKDVAMQLYSMADTLLERHQQLDHQSQRAFLSLRTMVLSALKRCKHPVADISLTTVELSLQQLRISRRNNRSVNANAA